MKCGNFLSNTFSELNFHHITPIVPSPFATGLALLGTWSSEYSPINVLTTTWKPNGRT